MDSETIKVKLSVGLEKIQKDRQEERQKSDLFESSACLNLDYINIGSVNVEYSSVLKSDHEGRVLRTCDCVDSGSCFRYHA